MIRRIADNLSIFFLLALILSLLPVVTYTVPVHAADDQFTPDLYSPTANAGSNWTNPTRAYDDGGTGAATITANTPSGTNIWGTYNITDLPDGAIIDQLRIRADAWSSGYAGSPTSETRYPTGNDANTVSATYAGGTSLWGCVDEAEPHNDADNITLVDNGGGHVTFTYTAFTTTTNAVVSNITVYIRARNGGTAHINASLKVGTTYYDAQGVEQDPGASFTDYNFVMTQNPATSANWTYDEINGTDATTTHRLNAFGIGTDDCNPDNFVSQCYAIVYYTPATEYDDELRTDVSWDGGTSWSSTNNTALTSSQATYWYDVTGATSWNVTKLNNTNFKVRALAYKNNSAEVVNLDWLAAEVTYSLTVSPPSSFTSPAQTTVSINLTWTKGTNADYTLIRYRDDGSYPTSTSNGTQAYNSTATLTTISGLSAGTTYKIRAWGFNSTTSEFSSSTADLTQATAEAPSGNITNSPDDYDFGNVAENDVKETGLGYFTVENDGAVIIDVTIQGTDMTGGNTWTLSDTATPGSNTVGFKAGLYSAEVTLGFSSDDEVTLGFTDGDEWDETGYTNQGDYLAVVKKTAPYNTLIYQMPVGAIYTWGLEFYAPTAFDDGVEKSGTITLTVSVP